MKWFALFFLFITSAFAVRSQTPDILPSDNLVADGVPPISASLVDSVRRYSEFRAASLADWHPTSLEMLISTRFGDAPQIHKVQFPGGARTQLTFFPDRIAGATYNPRNGEYFVFSKDVGGGEWYQNYRYDLETGTITLLTDGKSRNTPGVWSTAGDRMAYGSTRRNGKDIDFYIIDPRNPVSNRLLTQLDRGESWSVLNWAPNDSTILAKEEISVNESFLWLIDAVKGEKKLLTPKRGTVQISYEGGTFSRDGKGIYTTTDRESEFHRLTYIDIATGKHSYLTTHLAWDVESFELSRDGKTVAFVTDEDGVSVLRLLNTATGREQPVRGLPIGVIGSLRWHNDNEHLGFTMNFARATTDVYVLNVLTGRIERWTLSEAGGLPLETCAEPELIRWTTFDGKSISGFLYRPPKPFAGKRPVIVVIHGGPEGQSRPSFLGRYNYYLNELGVALVFPNIRGSLGYGKTFSKLDNGMLRENSYKDVSALLDWIKNQETLDGERIMITGGSYGGHATLAVATFYSDKIRCAVDVVGMSNLVTFLERTEAYRRDLRRVEYGDERDSTMRAYLQSIAPLNNVKKITKPLFVIQGKNDPRVPVSESEQIVTAVKHTGTPVWYLMAKDEGHGFQKKRNQDYQFFATVLFVRKFLLN
jgi:dipeptidyl aminopeptidase/acylaminoacyl peptidase